MMLHPLLYRQQSDVSVLNPSLRYKHIVGMLLAILCVTLSPLRMHAQEVQDSITNNRYTSHSLLFGVGSTNVLDSYLSPLEYTGWEGRIQRETFRQTKKMNGRVYVQTILNVHASYTENEAKTAEQYEGLLNWNIGWLYKFQISPNLSILAGPMAELNGGVVYLKRNSNNPAQAKAYANIAASGMALYKLRLFGKQMMLKYQMSAPVMGIMFSPEYGESYYEIFTLGHSGHNVCFTSVHNQPSLRQSLTLDFPLGGTTIRVGYLGDYQQSKVNNIKCHTYSNAFMIGFVKHFKLIKDNDKEMARTPYYQ